MTEAQRKWHEANRERLREAGRRWAELFEAQGCVCAICGSPDPRSKKGWNTDHDHAAEQILPVGRGRGRRRESDNIDWQLTVRGILCQPCNIGLGGFEDDPVRMRVAAAYVDRGPLARPREYLPDLSAGLLF